jgi:hypothetical protein
LVLKRQKFIHYLTLSQETGDCPDRSFVASIGASGKCRVKPLKCYFVYSTSFMIYKSRVIQLFITYAADKMSVKNERNKSYYLHTDGRKSNSDEVSCHCKAFTKIEEKENRGQTSISRTGTQPDTPEFE